MVEVALAAGLGGIAVTDHDSVEGAIEARRFAPPGFIVINGFERSTDAGDILGYFVHSVPESEDPVEVIRAIKAQGGLAVMAHPFASRLSLPKAVVEQLHGIEGFNARHPEPAAPDFGPEQMEAFARANRLTLTANSDAHTYAEIGRARTVMPGSTEDDVRQAILRGTTVLVRPPKGGLDALKARTAGFFRRLAR